MEYAAVLYHQWKDKKFDFYRIMNLYHELNHYKSSKIPEPEALERSYRNCLSDLEDCFDISVSVKRKSVQINSTESLEEKSFEIFSFYLKNAFSDLRGMHNDSLIQRYVRYRLFISPNEKEEMFIMNQLYLFTYIRHCIRYGMKMECSYKKLMSRDFSARRLYPLHLSSDSDYITLTALDSGDGLNKQFILANLNLNSDQSLLTEYIKSNNAKVKFNFTEYRKSPEGLFQKEEISYTIRISSFSLEHLLLNNDFYVRIIEDKGVEKIIEIKTADETALQNALFSYDKYFQILAPKSAAERFKDKLKRILENH